MRRFAGQQATVSAIATGCNGGNAGFGRTTTTAQIAAASAQGQILAKLDPCFGDVESARCKFGQLKSPLRATLRRRNAFPQQHSEHFAAIQK
jgi:hypothetical protein